LIASFLGLGAISFFVITSCQKEKAPIFAGQESSETPALTPSCEDFCSECGDDPCSPRTVLEAVTTPDDAANSQVNMILYHYAQAVREAAKNATYLQYMMGAMTVSNEGVSVSLLTLAQNNSSFASFINGKLRQSMSDNYIYPRGVETGVDALIATTSWDANAYLKAHLQYAGTYFDPVIYYKTKPVSGAESYPVTVLISQEVNDCDDAAGWKGDTPALVGETEGRSGNRVVLIVGVGADGNVNNPGAATLAGTAQDRTTTVRMKSIKIKGLDFRYENSGKSEIKGVYIRYSSNPIERNEQVYYHKICKNDIKNQNVVTNSNLMVIDGSWDSNSHYFGFYEYDWSAQFWTVPHPCTNESLKGQRKYPWEWYNVDFCGAANTYFPSLSGGDATRDNTRCTFVISGE